jgi:hypothetical protein
MINAKRAGIGVLIALALAGVGREASAQDKVYTVNPDGSMTATYSLTPDFKVTRQLSDGFKKASTDLSVYPVSLDDYVNLTSDSYYQTITKIESAFPLLNEVMPSIPSSPTESDYKQMKNYGEILVNLAVAYDKTGREQDIVETVIPRLAELAERYYDEAKKATGAEQTRLYTECVEKFYEAFTKKLGEDKWLKLNTIKESKTYLDRIIASFYATDKKEKYEPILPIFDAVIKM